MIRKIGYITNTLFDSITIITKSIRHMQTTLLVAPAPAVSTLPAKASIVYHQSNEILNPEPENNLRLGPVFYAGRSPFRIHVIILTCFAIPEGNGNQEGAYVTYVGYRKENEASFEFDEMIPSTTIETAEKTHTKACGFFEQSKLFLKSPC